MRPYLQTNSPIKIASLNNVGQMNKYYTLRHQQMSLSPDTPI